MTDFDEATDRVVGGIERKSRVINPKEKEIVAYHEAGHALVAESREHADRVAKISVIPRGVAALDYTQPQPTEDRYLMTRAELQDRVDVLLGGRVAEELVFGPPLQDERGARSRDVRGAPPGTLPQRPVDGSARVQQGDRAQDAEIEQLLETAHGRVRETLGKKRTILDALATRLTLVQLIVDAESRPGAGAR